MKLYAIAQLMRLDKPVGILLLLWPVLWSLWLACDGMPPWSILCLFILGVIVMRSAGCVINDIIDTNIDDKVQRTANRPLANQQLTKSTAWFVFLCLLCIAFLIVLQFNHKTILLSVVALLLACLYPLSKYYFKAPQLILGITFNFGVLMCFTAAVGKLSTTAWLIYITAIIWTLYYDTQYAMADKQDDLTIGIHSTAITFGQHDILMISLLQIIFFIGLLAIGFVDKLNIYYYISTFAAALLMVYQFTLIKKRDPSQCFKAFVNNQWLGSIIFAGILAQSWQ